MDWGDASVRTRNSISKGSKRRRRGLCGVRNRTIAPHRPSSGSEGRKIFVHASDLRCDESYVAIRTFAGIYPACCFYVRQDQNGDAVYGPLNARREIHLIIRRSVGDEDVACGFSGFPKARAFNGSPMSSGDVAVFVVRNRPLFTETEMTPIEFDRLQDQRCGPDWVKPYRMPPAPSVR